MLLTAIVSVVLAIATVGMHVAGFAIMFRVIIRLGEAPPTRGLPIASQLMRTAWFLLFVHALEIWVWALFYRFAHCFTDAESAFYFSASTYTSLGYGDVLLPFRWRVLGPVEALIGILMCGLSTSAFFALVSRLVKARTELKQADVRSRLSSRVTTR